MDIKFVLCEKRLRHTKALKKVQKEKYFYNFLFNLIPSLQKYKLLSGMNDVLFFAFINFSNEKNE